MAAFSRTVLDWSRRRRYEVSSTLESSGLRLPLQFVGEKESLRKTIPLFLEQSIRASPWYADNGQRTPSKRFDLISIQQKRHHLISNTLQEVMAACIVESPKRSKRVSLTSSASARSHPAPLTRTSRRLLRSSPLRSAPLTTEQAAHLQSIDRLQLPADTPKVDTTANPTSNPQSSGLASTLSSSHGIHQHVRAHTPPLSAARRRRLRRGLKIDDDNAHPRPRPRADDLGQQADHGGCAVEERRCFGAGEGYEGA